MQQAGLPGRAADACEIKRNARHLLCSWLDCVQNWPGALANAFSAPRTVPSGGMVARRFAGFARGAGSHPDGFQPAGIGIDHDRDTKCPRRLPPWCWFPPRRACAPSSGLWRHRSAHPGGDAGARERGIRGPCWKSLPDSAPHRTVSQAVARRYLRQARRVFRAGAGAGLEALADARRARAARRDPRSLPSCCMARAIRSSPGRAPQFLATPDSSGGAGSARRIADTLCRSPLRREIAQCIASARRRMASHAESPMNNNHRR